MFSVLFEVHPKTDQWDTYLAYANLLRPELLQIEGFVDNVRYASLTRNGWILSLSDWRDEKALVRWRTQTMHHGIQEMGRAEVFSDYHLRVGQVTSDNRVPEGYKLQEQRLDETETGEGTAITLIEANRLPDESTQASPFDVATWLGLRADIPGCVTWDVFDAVQTPGQVILLTSWRDRVAEEAFERVVALPDGARFRCIRVVREYGMFDRREAPQYYPDTLRTIPDHP